MRSACAGMKDGRRKAELRNNIDSTASVWVRRLRKLAVDPRFAGRIGRGMPSSEPRTLAPHQMVAMGGRPLSTPIRSRAKRGPVNVDRRRRRRELKLLKSGARASPSGVNNSILNVCPVCSRTVRFPAHFLARYPWTTARRQQRPRSPLHCAGYRYRYILTVR